MVAPAREPERGEQSHSRGAQEADRGNDRLDCALLGGVRKVLDRMAPLRDALLELMDLVVDVHGHPF
jgi:hypothetical protein